MPPAGTVTGVAGTATLVPGMTTAASTLGVKVTSLAPVLLSVTVRVSVRGWSTSVVWNETLTRSGAALS